MPARQLTFKKYVAEEEGRPPVKFWWRGLPARPVDLDGGQLLAGAGMTGIPLEQLSSGYLASPWQGHPEYAMVITRDIFFHPGDQYAISLESAPPLR